MSNSQETLPSRPLDDTHPQIDQNLLEQVVSKKALTLSSSLRINPMGEQFDTIVLPIIDKALREHLQLDANPTQPVNKSTLVKAINAGLNEREKLIIDGRRTVTLLGEENPYSGKYYYDLAIDSNEIEQARKEARNPEQYVHLSTLRKVTSMATQRRELIEQMSIIALSGSTKLSEDEVKQSYSHLLKDRFLQSIIVRGMVTETILLQLDPNREFFPFLISHDDIQMITENFPVVRSNEFMEQTIDALAPYLANSQRGELEVREIIKGYYNQLASLIKNWNKSVLENLLDPNSVKYWDKFTHLFSAFPIDPSGLGLTYIYSPEKLSDAIENGSPHLWENPITIDGYVIPSVGNITLALWAAKKSQTTAPRVVRSLELAKKYWGQYQRVLSNHPNKISLERKKLSSLEEEIFPDVQLEGFVKRFNTMGQKAATLRSIWNRFNRIIRYDTTLRIQLGEQSGFDSNFSPEMWNQYFDLKKRQYWKVIDNSEISVRENLKSAFKFGWTNFVDPFFQVEDVSTINREMIEDRMEIISTFLLEMKLNQNLQLPKVFLEHDGRGGELNKFFDIWASQVRNSPLGLKLVNAKQQTANNTPLGTRFFREWFIEDLKHQRVNLRKVLENSENIEDARESLQLVEEVEEALRSDSPDNATKSLSRLGRDSLTTFRRELELMILPEELRDPKTLEKILKNGDFDQAREVVEAYRKITRGYTFEIPRVEDIPDKLRQERDRPVAAGKESKAHWVRKVIKLLGESVDNPLVPWSESESLWLAPFVSIIRHRVDLVEALADIEEVSSELADTEAQLKEYQEKSKQSELRIKKRLVLARLDKLKSKLDSSGSDLVEEMVSLNFAIPEEEFNQMCSSQF